MGWLDRGYGALPSTVTDRQEIMARPTTLTRRALLAALGLGASLPAWAGKGRWSRRSPFNRVEVVTHDDGRVELLLDGSRQSSWYPEDPPTLVYGYIRGLVACIERTPLAETGRGRALLVGLGGGTLARVLRARWPEVEVHALEIDPVVVKAARRFFDLDPDVRVHVGDGRAFLDGDPGPWDLVVLDASSEDYVPPTLQSVACFRRVAQLLTPGGVVLGNAWRNAPNAASEAETWRFVFPGATERAVDNGEENRLFAAGPGWSPGPGDQRLEPTGAPLLQDP